MQALRRLSVGCIAFGLALGFSPAARSAPHEASASLVVGQKSACLAEHESAQLFSQAGRLRDAREVLHACARQSCPEFVRADCMQWLEGINDRIPSVVLVVHSPRGDEIDVRVSVDGQVVTGHLEGKAMDLNPGEHLFRFEHPSFAPVEQSLLVIEGEKNRRVLVTLREQGQRLNARPFVPPLVYGLTAITTLALSSSIYFGISAIRERQSLTRSCAPFCSQADVDAVRTKLIVADASLAVALISGGAAVWAVLSRGSISSEQAKPGAGELFGVGLVPNPAGGRLVVRGAF
jgi:hypothetical protein